MSSMTRETITLSQREHQRMHVVSRVLDGVLRDAAVDLALQDRRRLVMPDD
jgi:hypothetical protein